MRARFLAGLTAGVFLIVLLIATLSLNTIDAYIGLGGHSDLGDRACVWCHGGIVKETGHWTHSKEHTYRNGTPVEPKDPTFNSMCGQLGCHEFTFEPYKEGMHNAYDYEAKQLISGKRPNCTTCHHPHNTTQLHYFNYTMEIRDAIAIGKLEPDSTAVYEVCGYDSLCHVKEESDFEREYHGINRNCTICHGHTGVMWAHRSELTMRSNYSVVNKDVTIPEFKFYRVRETGGYVLGGGTVYVSGIWPDDTYYTDEVYVTFKSYATATATNELVLHSEVVTLPGLVYRMFKTAAADGPTYTITKPIDTVGRFYLDTWTFPLAGLSTIPAGTWTFYYYGETDEPKVASSVHFDVDIFIITKDGDVRASIATHVAESGDLPKLPTVLTGTYTNTTDYTIVDGSDYLRIDYYMDVVTARSGYNGIFYADHATGQPRLVFTTNVPTEYQATVEVRGESDTESWTKVYGLLQIGWFVQYRSGLTIPVEIAVYNWQTETYPTSGEAYQSYTGYTDVVDFRNFTIVTNPTAYRAANTTWKMRISATLDTVFNDRFQLNLDYVKFERVRSLSPLPNVDYTASALCSGDTRPEVGPGMGCHYGKWKNWTVSDHLGWDYWASALRADVTDPETRPNCTTCHSPHYAPGLRLWNQSYKDVEITFGKVKQPFVGGEDVKQCGYFTTCHKNETLGEGTFLKMPTVDVTVPPHGTHLGWNVTTDTANDGLLAYRIYRANCSTCHNPHNMSYLRYWGWNYTRYGFEQKAYYLGQEISPEDARTNVDKREAFCYGGGPSGGCPAHGEKWRDLYLYNLSKPVGFLDVGTYLIMNRTAPRFEVVAYLTLTFAAAETKTVEWYFYPELWLPWSLRAGSVRILLYLRQSASASFTFTAYLDDYASSTDYVTIGSGSNTVTPTSGATPMPYRVAAFYMSDYTVDAYRTLRLRLDIEASAASTLEIYSGSTDYESECDPVSEEDPIPIPEFAILGSLASAITAFAVYLRQRLARLKGWVGSIPSSVESLPEKVKRALIAHKGLWIVAVFIALAYHRDAIALWDAAWTVDYMRYILIVPIISAYLVYRKRRVLKAISLMGKRPSVSQELFGLAFCLFAFSLYFYGTFSIFQLQFHVASFMLFIAGCVLLFLGIDALRTLAFPIAYLALMIPLPVEFVHSLASSSIALSASAAFVLLRALNVPVSLIVHQGAYLMELASLTGEPLTFIVGLPCSGVYSLLGYAAFGLFLGYVARGSRLKKALIPLVGLFIVYTLNVVRIATIVGLGYAFGYGAAAEAFHLFGGWVLIAGASAVTIAYASMKLPKPSPLKIPRVRVKLKEGRRRFAVKIIALTGVLSLFFFANIAWIVAPKYLPAYIMVRSLDDVDAKPFLPPEFLGSRLTFAKPIVVHTGQDVVHLYRYGRLVTVYAEVVSNPLLLHFVWTWPFCMPKQEGWVLKARWDTLLSDSPYTPGYVFVFDAPNRGLTPVVVTFVDKAFGQVGDQKTLACVGISLLGYTEHFASAGVVDSPSDYRAVADELMKLGREIIDHWQQFKVRWMPMVVTYSLFANIETITLFYASLLVVGAVLLAVKGDITRDAIQRRLNRLSSNEQLTILSLAARGRLLQAPGDDNDFIRALRSLEEREFVKSKVVSIQDEPFVLWKVATPIVPTRLKPYRGLRFQVARWLSLKVGLVVATLGVIVYCLALYTGSLLTSYAGLLFITVGIVPIAIGVERYVRLDVASRSILSPLLTMERLLDEFDVEKAAVYVPPTVGMPEGSVFLPYKKKATKPREAEWSE